MTALTFVILALAAYRITRLFTLDSLTLAWRERLYRFAWDDEHPDERDGQWVAHARAPWRTYAYELATCSFCLGFWVAASVYSVWRWWANDATHAVIVIFAVAGLQALLASWEREG